MIKIGRSSEHTDKTRSYKIVLDNEYVGEINHNETKEIEVPQGKHNIYLKIDWCRSNKIDFYLLDNETIEFECGNSMKGWRILLSIIYVTFFKNNYLWIKIKNKNNYNFI